MKIEVTDKFGRVRLMNEKIARILQKSGRVTYMTRDMVAAPVVPPPVHVPVAPDAEAVREDDRVELDEQQAAPGHEIKAEMPESEDSEEEAEAPRRRGRPRKAQAEE